MHQNVERFLAPQESYYDEALKEIKSGYKSGHWIWWIFPQMRGLGFSPLSQLNRLKKVPKEIVGYDPLTKGTYYDSQLRKEKKELLKKIDNYKVMSLFCINVLTCCMSNKYKSSIPTDLSTKYSSFIQKANYQIDNYGKKVNKLKFLFPFLEINDKSIEYLKGNGKKGNYKLIVSIVNV